MRTAAWYWCLDHHRVEDGATACPPDHRLGPYESAAAAGRWRERLDARNEQWDMDQANWGAEDPA